jgi:hypothetical protein
LVKHFRELLNCPTPEIPPAIPPSETKLPINCENHLKQRSGKPSRHLDKYQQRPSKQTQRPPSPSYTTSSVRFEKRERYQSSERRDLSSSCLLKKISKTTATTMASCSFRSGVTLSSVLVEKMNETVNP